MTFDASVTSAQVRLGLSDVINARFGHQYHTPNAAAHWRSPPQRLTTQGLFTR